MCYISIATAFMQYGILFIFMLDVVGPVSFTVQYMYAMVRLSLERYTNSMATVTHGSIVHVAMFPNFTCLVYPFTLNFKFYEV